jgi:hypothetical protein
VKTFPENITKSFAEACATAQQAALANRGFLTNRQIVLVVGIGVVAAIFFGPQFCCQP